jgi:hypothetical protein
LSNRLRRKYFPIVSPDQDSLGDWDDPGWVNELGEMLQRLRVKGDNTIHNFNSYRVPVPSGFNVDLFQEMA